MEASPLTLAHDHARAASIATQSSDTTVALNEHTLAAGEFAKAATSTGSAEALRTLRLLEHHHKTISDLLRVLAGNPAATTPSEPEVQTKADKALSISAAVAELRASRLDLGPQVTNPRTRPNPQTPRRLPPREQSSSIISNLASARNIRASHTRLPLSPSSTSLQPANQSRKDIKRSTLPGTIPENGPRKTGRAPPQPNQVKAEAQTSTSRASVMAKPTPIVVPSNDEGFTRFYNAFERILFKLSAPLAFAGLPLASDEGTTEVMQEPTRNQLNKHDTKALMGSELDLTKYISRAALRASTRDGHTGNESFYVVPSTGGTVSYARIASLADREKRPPAGVAHAENADLFSDSKDEDDFVDAKEVPSPSLSRKFQQSNLSRLQLENTVEELGMENKSLKLNIDKLSKRLSLFEMSSQKSGSMLQESVRMMRTSSPAREPSFSNVPGTLATDQALRRKIVGLEEQALLGGKEIERLGKENDKLKSVVSRYRERWEKLKEGAKTRREAVGEKESGGKGEAIEGSPPRKGAPGERYLAG